MKIKTVGPNPNIIKICNSNQRKNKNHISFQGKRLFTPGQAFGLLFSAGVIVAMWNSKNAETPAGNKVQKQKTTVNYLTRNTEPEISLAKNCDTTFYKMISGENILKGQYRKAKALIRR